MAQSTLVDARFAAGLALIDRLVNSGVSITAAAWVKVIPENGPMEYDAKWWCILVSPSVDREGPGVVYRSAYEVMRKTPNVDLILDHVPLEMVRVVGAADPVAKDLFKIVERSSAGPPIYVARCRLGQIEASEVTITYVATLPAPWQQVKIKEPVAIQEPLLPHEIEVMRQIVASGINPGQADYPVLKNTIDSIPAGAVVNAREFGPVGDPDPVLLIKLPDGKKAVTVKSNREPVVASGVAADR